MADFILRQFPRFSAVRRDGFQHIAQQNLASLRAVLHHHPLLHKDGIRVRGVKVVGRNEVNPFLRGEIKAVLPGPFTLNLRLKQILTLRAAA